MSDPASPPTLPVWPVLAATTGTQSVTTLCALALSAVAPKAAAELGTGPGLAGYQVSLVYAGAVVTSLIGGGFVRRLGAGRTSQMALWLAAFGCLISAWGTLQTLVLGALVIGLGYGCTNPAASHLLSRTRSGAHMNLIFSIKQCGVPIGGMLAGLLIPPITLAFNWQMGLAFCALLGFGLSLLLQRARQAWDVDRLPDAPLLLSPLAGLHVVWRHPILRWLALCSFAYSAVQLSLTGLLVTYLVTEVGLHLVLAGTLLALAQTAGAFGRLAWGWLADRLKSGSKVLILNGVVAMLAAILTALIDASWPLSLTGATVMLFGFCAIGWNGVFMAVIARQAPPQSIGLATGATLSITFAGVVIGPSSFAFMHDALGLSYADGYLLMAFVTLIGALCMVIARRGIPAR
ncbi:MFS transporter [Ferrovibrio terrae]|uniref:MFS transporter n=1 Tax=Ferrovibrio terrae TaxID=2594003 RepID=UPI003137B379